MAVAFFLLTSAIPSHRVDIKTARKLVKQHMKKARAWAGEIPRWHFWTRDKGLDITVVRQHTEKARTIARNAGFEAEIDAEAKRLVEVSQRRSREKMSKLKIKSRWDWLWRFLKFFEVR